MALTPWLNPTALQPGYTDWDDSGRVLIDDGSYASTPGQYQGFFTLGVITDKGGTGTGSAFGPTPTLFEHRMPRSQYAVTTADLVDGKVRGYLSSRVIRDGETTTEYANVRAQGYDFSSIPTGSEIQAVTVRTRVYQQNGTVYADILQMRIEYIPAQQNISAEGVVVVASFGALTAAVAPLVVQIPSIASTVSFGEFVKNMYVGGAGNVLSASQVGSASVVQSAPPPPPPIDWSAIGTEDAKYYSYHVSKRNGEYLGTWQDVADTSEFNYSQPINSAAAHTVVRLARSPNTKKESRDVLVLDDGDSLVLDDNEQIAVLYETNNSVGPGTDVDDKLNVDVYAHYGAFDTLILDDGDELVLDDNDTILVASGAPGGQRVFSGWILDYDMIYGRESGVEVTLISHGTELTQLLVKEGENIVVNRASADIADHIKAILDTNPGKISYRPDSIDTTGVSIPVKFSLNTKQQAIDELVGQTPEGFYWYVDVAENILYMKQRASTPHHRFKMGYHIKDMRLKRTSEQIRNQVYFVGAEDVNGVSKLKKFDNATSQTDWGVGLHIITDRRYSLDASMQRRANKEMARYKNPIHVTTVTVSSAKYDIEEVKLGHSVAFENSENLQDILLQVVDIRKAATSVTMQLGEVLDAQREIVQDLTESLENEQFQSLPIAPS